MTLVGETDRKRNFIERRGAAQEQHGARNAETADVIADRAAVHAAERPREMHRMHTGDLRKVGRGHPTRLRRAQIIDRRWQPSRCMPFARMRRKRGEEIDRNRLDARGQTVIDQKKLPQLQRRVNERGGSDLDTIIGARAVFTHRIEPRWGDLDAEDLRTLAIESIIMPFALGMKDRGSWRTTEYLATTSFLVRSAQRKREVGELMFVTRQRRARPVRVLRQRKAGRLIRVQRAAEKLAGLKPHVLDVRGGGARVSRRRDHSPQTIDRIARTRH